MNFSASEGKNRKQELMNEEYKNLGWDNGTFKIELELPVEFKRDFVNKGMFGNKNKMAECFDRILSAIKYKNFSTTATYEREICEVMKIAMGNAKIEKRGIIATMEIRLDTLKTHIDETIQKTVDDVKKNFIEAMRTEITKLQTYKMFPHEETVYVERDEVLRIFDKYTTGGEENGENSNYPT